MAEKLVEYIKSEKGEPEKWLAEKLGAPAQKRMRPATHVGKYTHPYVKKEQSLQAAWLPGPEGYLCSGNFSTEFQDYAGSSAFLPYSKTIEAVMDDGRPVRKHLQEGSEALKRLGKADNQTIEQWRKALEEDMKESRHCNASDHRLKQIYFPLGNNQYRLMTLLPCSLLIWELKKRISGRVWPPEEIKPNGTEKKSPKAFFDQCGSDYGGTKSQNISFLNNENGGRARRLTCLPPTLDRTYSLPIRNFFNLVTPSRRGRPDQQNNMHQLFEALYKTLAYDPNTDWARKKKKGILRAIIEYGIILPAENIRENAPAGWSTDEKYSGLPKNQKAWLDPGRQRETDAEIAGREWKDAIARDIALLVTRNLQKTIKQDPKEKDIVMDDAFHSEISELAKEYLDG